MGTPFTRRALLAALGSTAATAVLAEAPLVSLRPQPRPRDRAPVPAAQPPLSRTELEALIARSGPGGTVGLAVHDMQDGDEILDLGADSVLPPASVAKALTALYALEVLGPARRFGTRLIAAGPLRDGVIEGDLVLAGDGDPTLVTDDLAGLAAQLKDAGVREVRGSFRVYGGALPYEDEIDESQLDHLGYNPAVSGLNLNFNRVHFEWARTGADYRISLDARSATYRPEVTVTRMRVADRSQPVYSYASAGEVDDWTVARGALGSGGSRWLPVRRPALYCGDVFRTFARSQGIILPAATRIGAVPDGAELGRHDSAPLETLVRDMLRYSTNLTAEAVGLSATKAASGMPADIPASAGAMNRWLAGRYGIAPALVDHSGLGDASRLSARDMAGLLARPAVRERLVPVLKTHPLKDAEGRPIDGHPAEIAAKTGTLNFVSTLAGYIRTAEGRDLSFAIFCSDLDRREIAKAAGDEIPDGSRYYNGRAKHLQQMLLHRWGLIYSG